MAGANWQVVRMLVQIVRQTPGFGMRRDELARRMGMTWAQCWPHCGLAYSRRYIDFVGDFVVAVPPCAAPVPAPPAPPVPAPARRRRARQAEIPGQDALL